MHRLSLLCVLLALSGCGGGARLAYGPGRTSYPEPGPPADPWRPYIREASNRMGVPQRWIRAVMQQESGGHAFRNGRAITSAAGAMGLMQLMPATYADMQNQYGLGDDPYEPHDNILAGTAYIRLMYGRYGAPAFLAAYNAGPQRLDDYLATGRELPNETVNYVAEVAPHLGTELAMTGPLSAYAGGVAPVGRSRPYATPVRLASYEQGAAAACDADSAYDPENPCREPAHEPGPEPGGLAVPVRGATYQAGIQAAGAGCVQDPDAAFDPDSPCRPAPPQAGPDAIPLETYRAPAPAAPAVVAASFLPPDGAWSVQVGAYGSAGQAHFAATMARQAAYAQLAYSRPLVQPTSRSGGTVLYRARLAGLARDGAGAACGALAQHSIPCMIVAPGS